MSQHLTIEHYKRRIESQYDIFGGGVEITDITQDNITNGDLMPLKDWLQSVGGGAFIDYDGHGVFAFQRGDGVWLTSKMSVKPSDITMFKINPPEWATHVLWFNR
jgi:hypothetical protein